MNTPLHSDAQSIARDPQRLVAPGAHAGLLFERFFSGYESDWKVAKDKSVWFSEFFTRDGRMSRLVGDRQFIENAATRQVRLVDALGGFGAVFALDWYFVTGLGNAHPLENGFHWHPTLGTPFVSGSAVKGFLRAWMKEWTSEDPETVIRSFGPERPEGGGDAENACAGDLIFFDALPVSPPSVGPDVMTPHMGGWYEKGAKQVNHPETLPADWHDPNPVPFLVTKDARFMFCVAPRRQSSQADIPRVLKHLRDALAMLGLGAKTATGYGHMHEESSKSFRYEEFLSQARAISSKAIEKAAVQQMSEQMREAVEFMRQWQGNVADQGALIFKTGELAERAVKEGWSPEDRLALYDLIMQTSYAKVNNPQKKKDRLAKINPLVGK